MGPFTQFSSAYLHLGAKGHPGGRFVGSGGRPSIGCSHISSSFIAGMAPAHFASTLNLLRRENERLDLENKRVQEMCATSKKEDDKLHSKIREIIRIVQNQGKALKEFVVAFQALQRK